MRALVITDDGNLALSDVDIRDPGPQEILVRVHATAVNRADLMQRRGAYPAPPGFPQNIPGLEYSGVVQSCGDGVERWRTGERVMGIIGGGSYAEYVVVHEDEALPVPEQMSLNDAAAIPEAYLTAHDALTGRLNVRAGESVLIHAVASGVGTAAASLAKLMGCRVFGTARSAWKLERVIRYGVDVAIDASSAEFVDVVLKETDGTGVNAVIDLVGGDYLTRNIRALATLGRIAVVGLVAGGHAPLDMRLLLNKRATIVGTVLRARSLQEKIAVTRFFERDVMPWLASGVLKPVVDRVLPIEEAMEAHRAMEANENFGKIVLSWNSIT